MLYYGSVRNKSTTSPTNLIIRYLIMERVKRNNINYFIYRFLRKNIQGRFLSQAFCQYPIVSQYPHHKEAGCL